MKYLLLLGVIAGLSYPAFGHQGGGDSYLHLTIKEDAIQAKLGISLRTLSQTTAFDDDGNYKVTADEMQRHLDAIADYALSRLTFSVGDTPCNAKHVKQEALGRFAIISFAPNCPTPFRSITIAYGLFFDVDPLHRGLLRLEHQERTHTAIFTSAQRTQHIQLVQSSLWRQFWDYISVDPPAELTGLLPYLGNPFGHSLSIAGIALLGFIGLHWTLAKIQVPAVAGSRSRRSQEKRVIRYSSYLAFLFIMLGAGRH